MSNYLLNAAIKYREMGFSVIPVKHDKTPFTKWEQFQTERASYDQLCEWWDQQPNANIAIVTGAISGINVIDVDSEAGNDTLSEFIPDTLLTPIERTPRGGWHYYFAYRPGLINRARAITDTDIRTDGGYIIVAPSTNGNGNGNNGNGYAWLDGLSITDIAPATMPEMLFDVLEQGSRQESKQENTGNALNGVEKGTRNSTAAQMAGKYISKGLSDVEVLDALKSWNQRNKPPMAEKELVKTVESIRKTDSGKPAPGMADLRTYLDLEIGAGQPFSSDSICRALGAFQKDQRQNIYQGLSRLVKDGELKRDPYKHGSYRRVATIEAYDLAANIQENKVFGLALPLGLDGLIDIKPNQLCGISGRYDAGKSSFLFDIEARNCESFKIIHILSEEWSASAIKERQQELGIEVPHRNISFYPMKPGWEDVIPAGPCLVLIDYLRADQNPYEVDSQIQRVLRNLDGGVAIFACQKHPGLDRPVGGQFAVHAVHHILMLDKWKDAFICKVFRTKNERNLEGYFRTFAINEKRYIEPKMKSWKPGLIKWDKDPAGGKADKVDKADKADRTDKNHVRNRGGS